MPSGSGDAPQRTVALKYGRLAVEEADLNTDLQKCG